jgi:hypothetical protein
VQRSPQRGFSPVSPFGGDGVGEKTVFTQGVEELEIENDDRSQFFNTLLMTTLRAAAQTSGITESLIFRASNLNFHFSSGLIECAENFDSTQERSFQLSFNGRLRTNYGSIDK